MAKPKIVRCLIRDRGEMERIVRETVHAQIQRESCIADRDADILKIGQKHNPAIDTLSEEIEGNLVILEQWSDAHPEEFGEARSILVEGHRLGYRLGQPKPEPTGKLTWKVIIASLKRWMAFTTGSRERTLAETYLRQKWEANKEAMLETYRRGKPEDETELADLGVQITQSEEFYIEPNREGQPGVRLASKEAA